MFSNSETFESGDHPTSKLLASSKLDSWPHRVKILEFEVAMLLDDKGFDFYVFESANLQIAKPSQIEAASIQPTLQMRTVLTLSNSKFLNPKTSNSKDLTSWRDAPGWYTFRFECFWIPKPPNRGSS